MVQLAVQLLDRNALDGGDRFLRRLLKHAESNPNHAIALLAVAWRLLDTITPPAGTVHQLVQALVEREFSTEVRQINTFRYPDSPLQPTSLHGFLPASPDDNSHSISEAFVRVISNRIDDPRIPRLLSALDYDTNYLHPSTEIPS